MSISAETARIQYTLTSTGQTLAVPFYFLASADLKVVKTDPDTDLDTTLTLTTDYSVTNAGNPAGGSVTMEVAAGAVDDIITIYRNDAITQPATYPSTGQFPSATVEQSQDRLTMLLQQLSLELKRTPRVAITKAEQAVIGSSFLGKMVGVDADGNFAPYAPVSPTYLEGSGVGVINVRNFGAIGDADNGDTDDTAAVQAAYDFAVAQGGGALYFPAVQSPSKGYICRLTILDNGIGIIGDGGEADFFQNTLFPPDNTAPTISIGDDSGQVHGLYLRNIAISGDTVAGAHAPAAIKSVSGWNCFFSHITAFGGLKTIWAEGGPNYGTSGLHFVQFQFRNDDIESGSRVILVKRTGLGYATNVTFTSGAINSHCEYVTEASGEFVYFTDVYIDHSPGKGLYFPGSGGIMCKGLTLDPAVSGAVVITIDDTTFDPARYIQGELNAAGQLVRFLPGPNDITLPNPATYFARNPRFMRPYVGDRLYFSPLSDPFDEAIYLDLVNVGGLRLVGARLCLPEVGGATEYADNAAAVTAGLPVGTLYRTGDAVKVVHA